MEWGLLGPGAGQSQPRRQSQHTQGPVLRNLHLSLCPLIIGGAWPPVTTHSCYSVIPIGERCGPGHSWVPITWTEQSHPLKQCPLSGFWHWWGLGSSQALKAPHKGKLHDPSFLHLPTQETHPTMSFPAWPAPASSSSWFENEVCKGPAEGPDDPLPFVWALLSSLQHGSARSKHLG